MSTNNRGAEDGMAVIRSFRDLDVYVLAREQAKQVFLISGGRKVFADRPDTTLLSRRECHDYGSLGASQIPSGVCQQDQRGLGRNHGNTSMARSRLAVRLYHPAAVS